MKLPEIKARYYLILLLPVGILLNMLSYNNSSVTEKLYSVTFYRAISQIISAVTGWIPVSVAEILLVIFVMFIIWRLIFLVIRLVREKQGRLSIFIMSAGNALVIASVIYFLFLVTWGFNYNRTSLPNIIGLKVEASSADQLEGLCNNLTDKANELRRQVMEDKDGVTSPAGGYRGVFSRAHKGYDAAVLPYPWLGGRYGLPKPVMLSGIMSYTDIWGVFFPLTCEPNVDILIPPPVLPSTACHEMAHQRGFAREDEANYIAYLTCNMNPDVDFQYSGTLLALTYSLDSLYGSSKEAYWRVHARLDKGIIRDFHAMDEYDRKHRSPLQDISSKVNDLYLKANNQTSGEKSYGMVVDLLLAQYKQGNLPK